MNAPPPGPEGASRPLFLDPERVAEAAYVEEDHGLPPDFSDDDLAEADPLPNEALKPRHREIARLHALGKTNNQICERLGYSQSRVSVLLKQAAIRAEVDRYRNKLYDRDVISALKDLGSDAVGVVEEILRSPKESMKLKAENARWVIEKLTGKAKQEVSVESNTLAAFMETVRQMHESGETLDIVDVTPSPEGGAGPQSGQKRIAAPQTETKFTKWLDENL